MINGWDEAVKRIHHAIAYGVNANDLSLGELADDICFAMDELARQNGMPEHNWEAEYEDVYGEDDDADA